MKQIIIGTAAVALWLSSCGVEDSGDASAKDPSSKVSSETVSSNRVVPPNPVEVVNENGVVLSHALSMRSEPKYPADFTHFDYVNPQAPKGGSVTAASTGTFDNFNLFARRGNGVPNGSLFYDSLMTSSQDEIDVLYGLIAEKVEYSPEHDWIIFHLRPEARHQDGKPITAEDVRFSFNKFYEEGIEDLKVYLDNVSSVEALDEHRVKFTLKNPDKEMFLFLGGSMDILPPQFWANKDFSEPLLEVPLGSGAYTVSDYSMGQYVVWERLDDYWAKDIPVNKGQLNLKFIRYDMYRDQIVQLEALKSGEIDYRYENVSKQWATQYTGSNFDAGYIIKGEFPDETPPNIQRYTFNTQSEVFKDERVREAIAYTMDFEWLNKNLFYSQYSRLRSYFQGTPFEAMGPPTPEELEILEPIRDQIPEEVFSAEYRSPATDGSGNIRPQIAEALKLLDEAGWVLDNQVLVHHETGEALEFELLLYSPTNERVAIPFQENLKKIGVEMSIRMVDSSQYINRIRDKDYDMISWMDGGSFYPGSGMPQRWHSDYVDSFYNTAGIANPAVDYLLDGMMDNLNDNQTLVHWTRALDRVLQWNHYGIFQWYGLVERLAYWDKFGRPEIKPKYGLGLETWWFDEEKASRLP